MAGDAFDRDLERLSAYIDDELTPDERQAVEARLAEDPALRAALDEMRANARLLAGLPRVKAPRNFTLDPAVYGRRPRGFDWWGARFAGALGAAASLVLVIGVVLLVGTGVTPSAAPDAAPIAAQATQGFDADATARGAAATMTASGPAEAEDLEATGTSEVMLFAAATAAVSDEAHPASAPEEAGREAAAMAASPLASPMATLAALPTQTAMPTPAAPMTAFPPLEVPDAGPWPERAGETQDALDTPGEQAYEANDAAAQTGAAPAAAPDVDTGTVAEGAPPPTPFGAAPRMTESPAPALGALPEEAERRAATGTPAPTATRVPPTSTALPTATPGPTEAPSPAEERAQGAVTDRVEVVSLGAAFVVAGVTLLFFAGLLFIAVLLYRQR